MAGPRNCYSRFFTADSHEPHAIATVALGQLYLNWGGMLYDLGRANEAIMHYDQGLSILEPYFRLEPRDEEAQRDACLKLHGNRAYALGSTGRHRQAADEWTKVVDLSQEPVPPFYRVALALEYSYSDEVDRAMTQAKLITPSPEISSADQYKLGCLYARTALASPNDTRVPPDQGVPLDHQHTAQAINWLKSAAQAGLLRDSANRAHAKTNPDLVSLSNCAAFNACSNFAPISPDRQFLHAPPDW